MAIVKIGKVFPLWRGKYDSSTKYTGWDVVYYQGATYIAKTTITDTFSGVLPTNTSKWDQTSWFDEDKVAVSAQISDLQTQIDKLKAEVEKLKSSASS